MEDLYLYDEDEELAWNFSDSIFPMTTINMGPETVTDAHKDGANLAAGWCAITALGNFDPKKGGRIVLAELGLSIVFPPGSTICIPSALITHYNTPIQKGETRYSITQYCSGHICRWLENGFLTDIECQAIPGLWEKVTAERRTFKEWLELFTHWNDL